jgi:glycerol-3-phosphate acyltransferase PlsY
MADAATLVALLRTTAALLGGYLAGSVPLAAWIGRAAGMPLPGPTDPDPGAATVWRLAGPGAGLLALTGELAKGVVPVALAIATFGWWTGWVAAVGAVAGAGWPAFGRREGGHGMATLAGACLALAPVAGALALAAGGLVAAAAGLVGRDARLPAMVAGFAAFLGLALVELADAARLLGLGLLVLLAVGRLAAGRPRRRRGATAGEAE